MELKNPIKIVAFLYDSLGPRFVVKLIDKNKQYAFIGPPNYRIKKLEPELMLIAAVSKYGYTLLKYPIIIKDHQELLDFIHTFQKTKH